MQHAEALQVVHVELWRLDQQVADDSWHYHSGNARRGVPDASFRALLEQH
jgi:hypothetical protein